MCSWAMQMRVSIRQLNICLRLSERKGWNVLQDQEQALRVVSVCMMLCNPMDCSLPGSVHGVLYKNTGVGRHFHFQVIFPTQGSNAGPLYYRWILYCLSQQGSPLSYSKYKTWEMAKCRVGKENSQSTLINNGHGSKISSPTIEPTIKLRE